VHQEVWELVDLVRIERGAESERVNHEGGNLRGHLVAAAGPVMVGAGSHGLIV
jgi:hypothetical protein